MLASVALGLLGLTLLTLGGEWLVRGATSVARLFGLTPAVIGLTVVAAGTSFPELTVSVISAWEGRPDLAVGNVIGSNIMNTTLILGLTALVIPLPVHGNVVRLEWPVMAISSLVCWAFMQDAQIDRIEAAVFLAGLITFIAYSVRLARREMTRREKGDFSENAVDRSVSKRPAGLVVSLMILFGGLAFLLMGGSFLVRAATDLARAAGLSERVIGLTIVAAGTSAPEIAATLAAAWKGHPDVAIANVVGSNIMNILGILGLTGMIHPIVFDPALGGYDMWWLLGTAFLLFPLLRTGMTIVRWEGGLLLAAYVTYIGLLLIS